MTMGVSNLGILKTDQMKEKVMKELLSKEYKQKLKLVLKTKLSGMNKILAIIVALRYSTNVIE